MLIIISPSKSQDFSPNHYPDYSYPRQISQSQMLIDLLKGLAPPALASLMNISDQLSELNYQRFQAFHTPMTLSNAKQALLAFKGDVYRGIDIKNYAQEDVNYAQQHLRILSGLYGVLRPLDLIQPYRLEMGTALRNPQGKHLYAFWGNQITELLNQDLEKNPRWVINLASKEYFKVIQPQYLKAKILTLTFKENKKGVYKVIAIHAKRARGLMTNFIIKNRLTDCQLLKTFTLEGYCFNSPLSTAHEWVFSR